MDSTNIVESTQAFTYSSPLFCLVHLHLNLSWTACVCMLRTKLETFTTPENAYIEIFLVSIYHFQEVKGSRPDNGWVVPIVCSLSRSLYSTWGEMFFSCGWHNRYLKKKKKMLMIIIMFKENHVMSWNIFLLHKTRLIYSKHIQQNKRTRGLFMSHHSFFLGSWTSTRHSPDLIINQGWRRSASVLSIDTT